MNESIWRRRAIAAVPWIKRLVLLAVLFGLITAANESIVRWHAETALLQTQVDQLLGQAESASDNAVRTKLLAEASTLTRQVPTIANLRWGRLSFSALLYAAGLLPPCFVLYRAVNATGVPCSLGRATAAQLLGHAGKYIPGKAMVVVLRVDAIVKRHNDSLAPSSTKRDSILVASSVFFETLLMMGVGGLVAGILLARAELPFWVRAMAVVMATGSVIPVCPPVMRKLVSLVQKKDAETSPDLGLTWPVLARGFLASLASWLLIGASFVFLIMAIPSTESISNPWSLFPVATSAIALGMVLGFASLLPGGAGVREYVTLLVLTPVIGPTHALLSVIAARLMFIFVESLLAGFAWLAIRTQ